MAVWLATPCSISRRTWTCAAQECARFPESISAKLLTLSVGANIASGQAPKTSELPDHMLQSGNGAIPFPESAPFYADCGGAIGEIWVFLSRPLNSRVWLQSCLGLLLAPLFSSETGTKSRACIVPAKQKGLGQGCLPPRSLPCPNPRGSMSIFF